VHSGTTDVDVQVNLEIAAGTVNAQRLERALLNAEFVPDAERVWRWRTGNGGGLAMVKFELLADLDDQPAGATVVFDGCDDLGAGDIVLTRFGSELAAVRTALDDLRDNFADVAAQGAAAYADEMLGNHPDLEHRALLADGVTAVGEFYAMLRS
jgi:hypothetical protein